MDRPDTNIEFPTGNPRVRSGRVEVLSDNWYVLHKATFEYRMPDGTWAEQQRETYHHGNGATLLLFDRTRRTVVLTRQFRVPAYLNGHPDGMLIETAAGLLDHDAESVEEAIRREAAEETGYRVDEVTRLFELFMSPGSVTERLAFFAAGYSAHERRSDGGGLDEEGEDIEVLELPLDEAWAMVERGEIVDAKTVILLQWARTQS